jgi:hypothetical protein
MAGALGKLVVAVVVVAELTTPGEADADVTPAATAECVPALTASRVVAALAGAMPAAADESPVVAANRGAAPARFAALPDVTDDGAASCAEDCVAGEMTFSAPLRGADAAPARDETPARPSARGAAKWGTAEDAAPSGVCAIAAQVHPKIPITEQYAKARIDCRMA